MSGRAPRVSVILPLYNNARDVGPAIDSVLDQTMADLELVIVDDGSSDDTLEVVRRFDDPRIVVLAQENHGGAHATNVGIRAARGRYVALFAGDDVCRPERLERELAFLEASGGPIVFSWASFIDDAGDPLAGEHFASGWFNHPERTRPEMLAWFFFHGNYLCTVSCLAERRLLLDAGLFPVTAAQVPDFAMWLSLIRDHELPLLPEPLVEYRVHADGRNVSSPLNARRAELELVQVYRGVFDGLPVELFRQAFAGRLRHPDFQPGPEHEMEKALLYLQHPRPSVRRLGAERLWRQLQDPGQLAVAEARYDFGLPRLFELSDSLDVVASVEYLQLRQWALAVEKECKSLRRAVEASEGEYAALRQALDTAEAEYRKLEAYTRHVLEVKDQIQAELERVVAGK